MKRIKWLDEGIRLRIQSEDDLWILSKICRSGCLVGMLSHRRDSTTGTKEEGRAKSAERKPMWILLEVIENYFQSFTDNLRIHGTIKEAKIDIGSHHTHVISLGDEVMTNSGILGRITRLRDSYIVISVSKETEMTISRAAVTQVLPKGTIESIN